MAPEDKGMRMKVLARLHGKKKAEAEDSEEQQREYRCQVCARSFGCPQALGGHKKAHRQEQEAATKDDARTLSFPGRRMYLFLPGVSSSSSSSSGIILAGTRTQVLSHQYPSSLSENFDDELDLTLRL